MLKLWNTNSPHFITAASSMFTLPYFSLFSSMISSPPSCSYEKENWPTCNQLYHRAAFIKKYPNVCISGKPQTPLMCNRCASCWPGKTMAPADKFFHVTVFLLQPEYSRCKIASAAWTKNNLPVMVLTYTYSVSIIRQQCSQANIVPNDWNM